MEFVGYELDWRDPIMGLLPMENFAIYADGYFVPPKDGDYTFYVAADDVLELYMSTEPDSNDPSKLV